MITERLWSAESIEISDLVRRLGAQCGKPGIVVPRGVERFVANPKEAPVSANGFA
jgi:hypothetical protein